MRRGRLSLQGIAAHTRLALKHLQIGVAVLVQQNLVYFSADSEYGPAFYEAKLEAAYALCRSGKILDMVECRLGSVAAFLVQRLFLTGHTKLSDLLDTPISGSPLQVKDQDALNLSNGAKSLFSRAKVGAALLDLLDHGFVHPIKESMFRSPKDTEARVEREVLQKHFSGILKGNKQKDEMSRIVKRYLRDIRDEGQWHVGGRKRRSDEHGANDNAKRRKLSALDAATTEDEASLGKLESLDVSN